MAENSKWEAKGPPVSCNWTWQGGVVGDGPPQSCSVATGQWALSAVRPEAKGTWGRSLNAVSRAVALTEGAVIEEPAGH